MSTPPNKQPKFTLASPGKDSSDDESRNTIAIVLDETNANINAHSNLSHTYDNLNPGPNTNSSPIKDAPNVISDVNNGNITASTNSPINIITDNNNVNSDSIESPAEDENGNGNKLDGSDLSFTKKDPRKSRTQSFQSVLSTASLKSLKQQALASVPNNVNIGTRNGSISHNNISNLHTNSSNSNPNINATASRNFQSFIQAPVLSSITNLKMTDDIEIGQQLPFTESKVTSQRNRNHSMTSSTITATTNANTVSLANPNAASTIQSKSELDHDEEYEDTIIQQQKLTLNALKKLSLSPMPINTSDNSLTKRPLKRASSKPKIDTAQASKESITSSTSAPGSKTRTHEPYQPAEVDLSSFASLTRQPKVATDKLPSPGVTSASTSAVTGFGERDSSNLNTNTSTTSDPNLIQSGKPGLSQKRSLPSLPEGQQFVENVEAEPNAVHSNSGNGSQTYQYQQQVHQASQQQYQYAKQDGHHSHLNRIPSAVVPPQNMNAKRVPSGGYQAPNVYNSHMASQTQQNQHLHYPKANRQLQQIKGFRSPMYVPAVLRMSTLSTVSPTNSNTSGSNPNSPNELSTSPKNGAYYEHDHLNLNEPAATPRSSSRASLKSFDSGISVESSSSTTNQPGSSPFLSLLGKNGNPESYIFRAPPTRKHWVKDEAVLKCGMPFCSKVFNFFERRHHCRKCGGIYCKEHTSHYLYINHLAQFTTGGRGTLSKVCDLCIEEYNDFIQHEFGVSIAHSSSENSVSHSTEHIARTSNSNTIGNNINNSIAKSNTASIGSALDAVGPRKDSKSSQTPNPQYLRNGINPGKSHLIGVNPNDEPNQRSEQAVGSVPANWSWSSF